MALNIKAETDTDPQRPCTPPPADAVIDKLRDLVSSHYLNADPSSVQIRAGALFARLKSQNRAANAAARSRKQETADARLEMDATHLGLQNLQYEKRHLEREIEKCRQFGSIYQDVPFHTLDEFQRLAPEEARTADVMQNEHQLMLNRLSFELAERQRLLLRRKELEHLKDEMLKQGKTKLAVVDNVKTQVEALSKMAADIQKKVNDMVLPFTLLPFALEHESPVPS